MPQLTIKQLAAGLEIDDRLVARYIARGMPTNSVGAARSWKKANIRARAGPGTKPPKSGAADAPPRQPRAEHAQIRVLAARGLLVDAEKVRNELARHLAGLRDSLLQIPARLQSVLAAETDEAKVHDLLQDELHQALAAVVIEAK